MVIHSLQTQVEHLELAARTQASVGLVAFKDNLDAFLKEVNRMKETSLRQTPSVSSPHGDFVPFIKVISSSAFLGGPGGFKQTFREAYPQKNINSFIYFLSPMKEATYYQKYKHITSCLSRIAQETMVPNLMNCSIWTAVREVIIDEFGSAQTLSN